MLFLYNTEVQYKWLLLIDIYCTKYTNTQIQPQGAQFQFGDWNNIDSNKIGNGKKALLYYQTEAKKTIAHDFLDVFSRRVN